MKTLIGIPLVVAGTLALLAACSDDDSPGGGDTGGNAGQGGEAGTTPGGKSNGGSGNQAGSRPMGGSQNPGGSGEAGQGGADPGFTTPRGSCAIDAKVGRFNVEAQKDFGVVQGTILEGPVPTSIDELAEEEGDCKLLKRRSLVCSPACVGAETCGEDGKCIPYPRQVDVGEVSISGLTKPTKMTPQKPGAVYFAMGSDNPPFEPGSRVILSAEGKGAQAAFQLFGVGSKPLKEAPSWLLEEGKDLALSWDAPTEDFGTQVFVELTIDQHGNSPLSLSCELPDTGEGIVPKKLIDEMINSGVSGFPNGRIVRRTIDKVDVAAGCVELSVGSAFSATVRVSGFTPCNSPGDCPNGQTCNTVKELCE